MITPEHITSALQHESLLEPPRYIKYWRAMNDGEIETYLKNTEPENRFIIHIWGAIEAQGLKPTGADTMMSEVAATVLASRIKDTTGAPIIFSDTFRDVACTSATEPFTGSLGLEHWKTERSVENTFIAQMWLRLLRNFQQKGISRHFIVNGDGGNWQNYWNRPEIEDFRSLGQYVQQEIPGVEFEGCNWDQEGLSFKHADQYSHECVQWLTTQAPPLYLNTAWRVGLRPFTPEELQAHNGIAHVSVDPVTGKRITDWDGVRADKRSHASAEFNLEEFNRFLQGDVAADYEIKMSQLEKASRRFYTHS